MRQRNFAVSTSVAMVVSAGIVESQYMRCKPDFIAAQRKHEHHTTFAAHVRNLTPAAVSLSVQFGTLDGLPQMSADAQRALRARNRARYAMRTSDTLLPASENPLESARARLERAAAWRAMGRPRNHLPEIKSLSGTAG